MGYNVDLNNDGAADPGSDNLFVKLLMNQQAAGEPAVTAPDSGVNFMSMMDQADKLFPSQDAERKALLAKREEITGPDAMKKKANVMMGGLGVIALLSMLGGAKGRGNMGNVMQSWGQGFQTADKSMTDLQTGQIDRSLASTDQATKDRGNVLKSILLRSMMQQGNSGTKGASGAGGIAPEHLRGALLQKQASGIALSPQEQKVLDQLTPTEATPKTPELPGDVRAFQAFNPGVQIGTPEAAKAYVTWQNSMKNDPYLPMAVQMTINDPKTMRMTPDQLKAQIGVNYEVIKSNQGGAGAPAPSFVPASLLQGLKFNGPSAVPTYRYDAQGNRVQ